MFIIGFILFILFGVIPLSLLNNEITVWDEIWITVSSPWWWVGVVVVVFAWWAGAKPKQY